MKIAPTTVSPSWPTNATALKTSPITKALCVQDVVNVGLAAFPFHLLAEA